MSLRLLSIVAASFVIAVVTVASPGCEKVKKMLPASTIDSPEPESPEWVVQQVLAAAMDPDENAAWARYRQLLHPKETITTKRLMSWRQNNLNTLRRKWDLFVVNGDGDACRKAKCDRKAAKPVYKKQYDEEYNRGEGLKVFVVNGGNPDNPTPCNLLRTKEGKWRIHNGCLN